MNRLLWSFATLTCLCAAPPAAAQSPARPIADDLFAKGMALMDMGDFEKACPFLEDSNQLDPQPPVLFLIAECWDKAGRIATACTYYEQFRAKVRALSLPELSRFHNRAEAAAGRISALESDIPRILLRPTHPVPDGVVIQLDKEELRASSLNVTLSIDPGEHSIHVVAPQPSAAERFRIDRGELVVIELDLRPWPVPRPRVPARAAAAARPSWRRPAAYIAGGVGLGGLLVGAVAGSAVLAKKGIVEENCEGTACNAQGKAAADEARPLALASNIAFAAGVAGLAAGAVLLLTEDQAPAAAVSRVHVKIVPSASGAVGQLWGVW